MSQPSQTDVLRAVDQLIERDGMTWLQNFQRLLDRLLLKKEVGDCFLDLSLTAVVLCRWPRATSRHKPVLVIRPATSQNVVIEFQVTHTTHPAVRRTTESANCRYEVAEAEFDRLLIEFVKMSADLNRENEGRPA